MTDRKLILNKYKKADGALQGAILLIDNKMWAAAINRLYYAASHMIFALLQVINKTPKSPGEVRKLVFENFIKEGIFENEMGKMYSKLFDWRQVGDYRDDEEVTKEIVMSFFEPVKELMEKGKEEIESIENE